MIAPLLLLQGLAQPLQAADTWTLVVYGGSDNDSEASFCPDMADLMESLDIPGLTVLAFVDRSPKYSSNDRALAGDFSDARLFRLTSQGARRVDGGEAFPEIGADRGYEANSGDPRTVARVVRWAKATAPAERYGMIFYSHGSGRSWCPDETDGDQLFPAELNAVLEARDSLDLVVFDVCSMAGVENAYQWRPGPDRFGIDVMVATPMAGFPFPWRRILGRLEDGVSDLSAAALGRVVVEETERERRAELATGETEGPELLTLRSEAMTCLDLAQAAAAKSAIDRLATALDAWHGAKASLEGLVGTSEDPETMHYMVPGEPSWLSMPYFDIYDLAIRIAGLEGAPPAVRAAGSEVALTVDAMVIASYGMPDYERFGGFDAGRHGLYIVLPDGDESGLG